MCNTPPVAEWSEEEADAFGEAARAALMAKGVTLAQLAEAMTELGNKTSQPQLSQWINGKHEPPRRMVFAMERALRLRPGALSRTLGYLPILAKPVTTVLDAIEADPRLSDEGKTAVLLMYREMARRG